MDLIGRRLSHYLLEARLGAGGMAVVYRARDLALGREAALKVLPPDFPEALRPRLRQESEGCARLQHPAIATFYEAGESDGILFLAMEYVDGVTLRRRLEEGPLPSGAAVAMTESLLEALAHAHGVGIVHRDIKPENIMIARDGRAKLLDFGLLKGVDSPDAGEMATLEARLTAEGRVVGTVGYMSPEQLRGEPVTPRSDLYGMGLVLREAITGRPAWEGSGVARLTAPLHVDLAPVDLPGQPAGLREILARALCREPAGRYGSAAEFLSALRAIGGQPSPPAALETMVVLDLRGVRPDADSDWIGSAVSESITADLSRAPGVQILGREKVARAASALRASGREPDPLDLGVAMGCRWVVSGSFQRLGPALRLTARVMEIPTGRVAAAPKIDGSVDDLFRLQDQLSASLLSAIDRGAAAAPGAPAPSHLKAYERHAKGRRHLLAHGKAEMDQAREHFEAAARIDPSYAAPLAGLAAVHALQFTFTTDPASLQVASGYARRAIELEPTLGEPWVWLAYALMRERRFDEAVEAARRATQLEPHGVMGHYFAGCARAFGLRPTEAIPFFQKALEREPMHGWSLLGLGWCHLDAGRAAEARWCLEQAVALERRGGGAAGPTAGVGGYLGEMLRRAGELEAARAACLEALDLVERTDHMYRDTFRAVALCALGRTGLQAGDPDAARAAFSQAAAQMRGRVRALGGGHLLVQALAGMARAGEAGCLAQARALFDSRRGHNFSDLWICADGTTLLELSRAASACGEPAEAAALEARARAAGATEP